MRPVAVRGMEKLGEWETAKKYCIILGRIEDANACQSIIDSTNLGDRYREITKYLYKWVEEMVEQGIMSEEEALRKIYPETVKIYDEIYNV